MLDLVMGHDDRFWALPEWIMKQM